MTSKRNGTSILTMDTLTNIINGLTQAQKRVLRTAKLGYVHGGRGGWNTAWLRALEKKGLVTLHKEYRWDSEWKLTEVGYEVSKVVKAEWLAGLTDNNPK